MDIINLVQVLDKGFCESTKAIWGLIGYVITVLQIAIPIIIVLLGTLDLGKAVMAGEEKQIKDAQKMLIKRIIYGVVIFFVAVIVKYVFGMVSDSIDSDGSKCWDCIANPSGCKIKDNLK